MAAKLFQTNDMTLIDPPICIQGHDADIAPDPLNIGPDSSESVVVTIGQTSQSSTCFSSESGSVHSISIQELKTRLHTIRFNVGLLMLKMNNSLGSAAEFQKLCSCSDELPKKLAYSSYAGYGAALYLCAEPSVNKALSKGDPAGEDGGVALMTGCIDAWTKARNMCEESFPPDADADASQLMRAEHSLLTDWITDASAILAELRRIHCKANSLISVIDRDKELHEACDSISANSISDLSDSECYYWSNGIRKVEPREKALIYNSKNQNCKQQQDASITILQRRSSVASCGGDSTYSTEIYSYDVLQYPGPYPAGVNVKAREMYLSETEFATIFGGMDREQFLKLPLWKQVREIS
jgi:hypothetical protein